MSKVGEKVAYLKGLAEGLGVNGETEQGKLMLAMIDTLEALAKNSEEIDERVEELSEYVEEIDSDVSDLEEALFLDDEDEEDDDEAYEDEDDDEDEHEHHHEHHYDEHGVCSCGHHHHHDHDADEVFTSWGKETAHKYSREDLDKALHALDEGAYGMILRAKGIVDGGDTWYEFDMVPGEHEIRTCGPDVTGKLCVIGSELKEHEIAELFHV